MCTVALMTFNFPDNGTFDSNGHERPNCGAVYEGMDVALPAI